MVKDLTGLKFGKLTVLKLEKTKQKFKENGLKAGKLYYWLCKCECGKLSIVEHYKLINKTRSCGCLKIKCVCEWAEDIGITEATLRYRLKAWGIEKALNTPKQW